MTDAMNLLVKLQADVSQLKTGLAQAESAIKGVDSSVQKADTGMKSMIGSLKGVAATMGAAFAGTQIVQFAKDTVMAASSMAESVSKVNVVFGQGASEVLKFGESAAENLGISNQAALEAAGTYGNLFQAFGLGQGQAQQMSTSLVQLASDMASFNNTSIDDAITALRSGLSGETEPLKRFGVALQDTRLKTEAFSMGLIKSTKDALTPAAKAQAAYAIIMRDTALAQGDYARTADGTANTMKTLKAKFDDAKVALGEALMPAFRALLTLLNILVPVLTAIGKFFKENATAIKIYSALVLGLVGAFTAYKVILTTTKTVKTAYLAVQTAMNNGIKLQTILTLNLKVAWQALNAAMRANPIGVIVTALMLLGAAFVAAWKKSETFRSIVIKGMQGVLYGVAMLIEGIGQLLKVFSKIPGMGWAKGISDGALKAAESIKKVSRNLDDLNRKGAVGNFQMSTGTTLGTTPTRAGAGVDTSAAAEAAAKAAEKEKERLKKLKEYKKDVKDTYKEMNEVISEANEKAAKELAERDERIADARENYAERVADIEKTYARAKRDALADYNKATRDAKAANVKELANIAKEYREKIAEIEEANAEKVQDINERAKERLADIEERYQAKIADLREKAAEKQAEIAAAGVKKQADIVEKSMDRLRSAFSSGVSLSLSDAFKETGTAGGLLETLRKRFSDAQALAKGAAELAGRGYSQTFIEQVVKAGPSAGLGMIEELKAATPEQQAELIATFSQLESFTETGLNGLAMTMNQGGNLATAELREAFQQVTIDVQASLSEVNTALQKSLADAQTEYSKNVTEVNKELMKALEEQQKAFEKAKAEAAKIRDERIAESMERLQEALAKADEAYKEALAKATENYNDALEDAAKTLQKALIDAQKSYEKAIDEINKSTQKKLAQLKADLLEIASLISKAGGSAGGIVSGAPTFTPIVPKTTIPTGTGSTVTNNTTNVTVETTNLTQPLETASAIVSMIKYGQVVQVAAQPGMVTTGLAAARAGITGGME
jgi:hypothetical protein